MGRLTKLWVWGVDDHMFNFNYRGRTLMLMPYAISTQFIQVLINGAQSLLFMHYASNVTHLLHNKTVKG
jgi:hypothetical protein